MNLSVVILAAGQGKRMRSALPKVLHRLGGKPLLEHAYRAARDLRPEQVYVVYGHGGEQVRDALGYLGIQWVEQDRQLGTGHAVVQVLPFIESGIDPNDTVLVLYGDVPLITSETLDRLVKGSGGGRLSLLTVELPDPSGYGRIVRDAAGRVQRIIEDRDARPEERAIGEVNTGMMAVSASHLKGWVARLENRNAQGEYYLTDVIAMAVADGVAVEPVSPASVFEVMGVNDRVQLAELERRYQRCQAEQLMRQGVTLLDPARFDLRGDLQAGQDVVIDVNVVLEGRVRMGDRVIIGPNNWIRDTDIGDDASILPNCVIEGAEIGRGARVGPFSRLRPETRLAEEVHIGNFVEVKKAAVMSGTKINHLSYIGDAEVGRDTNIGAGTITCNYDGANKHKTVIGDQVFIGSDTQLIAPVKVGDGATIGAGTTLTQDAPPGQLTVGRARQTTIAGWERPKKKKVARRRVVSAAPTTMRVGYYQFRPLFGQPRRNVAKVLAALADTTADLIVLPELAFSGYHFRDREEALALAEDPASSETVESLTALCLKRDLHLVTGFCERFGERVYNSALLIGPRGVEHLYRKLHLFAEEKRCFDPGDIPLSVQEVRGTRIGLMVCFDWAFPEVARVLAIQGAEILCHPSNLILGFCQQAMLTRCFENRVYAITANRFGSDKRPHGELRFTGKSQVVAPGGRLIHRAPSQREQLYVTEINLAEARNKRITPWNDLLSDRRPEWYRDLEALPVPGPVP